MGGEWRPDASTVSRDAHPRVGVSVPPGGSWVAHGAGLDSTMSATPLAAAYAVFANRGFAIEPTRDGSGARRRVLSEGTADALVCMLEAAVSDDGTGRRARVEGHRVGGKTGTTPDGVALFAGLAPLEQPRYVIVVRVEGADGWGGTVAAHSFARVARALLD